ncbi:MAG TPA: proton-conducting transporter membrane subunit [Gemmatimonadaceae bacterium]|jgi:hydrogenase-4 component F|nr:proton-conducting transporter membrane subunit [Gemmatimonadaceae bacterium]
MILLALVLVPALAAGGAYFLRGGRARSLLLLSCGAIHVAFVAVLWVQRGDATALSGWLAVDALGRVVLTLLSMLFLAVAHYSVGYHAALRARGTRRGRVFESCTLAFLAAASLVALSHHLALLWIGMEATTLAVAPLVFDRRDRRSLEAVWKYLVLSSVGIAFALLGIFLLATAQPTGAEAGRPLVFGDMIEHAALLDPAWLRAAFVFVAIGFGTKMGLAPMHSWKPDTYGEAPGHVAGLMAGALTSCAFLGVARVTAICFAAGQGPFVRPVLIGLGLTSLAIAAAFIVGQGDVRRLLAYSSVEHMGLLVLGVGLGGTGAYGAVLHTLNNGLAKGLMFLAAGNVVLATGTSAASEIRGLLRILPVTGTLLVIGLFAVTGSPPFGLFISEFTILRAAFSEQHPWVAATTILLLVVIFVGIAGMILELTYGTPAVGQSAPRQAAPAERSSLVLAPALLAFVVLALGVYIPAPLAEALARAASVLGGHAP